MVFECYFLDIWVLNVVKNPMPDAPDKFLMFRNRLEKVSRHLGRLARRQGISCYRVYDHDLPEFPFCIECYGDRLAVSEYQRHHGMEDAAYADWLDRSLDVIGGVLGVDRSAIFLRLRRRKAGREGQYRKADDLQAECIVQEDGLSFIVNLSDYLDTGLYLDHRTTRRRVREESTGKSVLNLFAYTGSFSVHAAAGGAVGVVTVDLSRTYLNWARRNMELNGFVDPDRYRYVQADVRAFLKDEPRPHFDLIILDPPSFSNSSRMDGILDVQRDHSELIQDTLMWLRPGGRLYFSTNLRGFRFEYDPFPGVSVRDVTRATTPFDFEGHFSRWCFLLEKEGAG
jgi:23S rRNA (cytosine1962-C5)-methyltransferase